MWCSIVLWAKQACGLVQHCKKGIKGVPGMGTALQLRQGHHCSLQTGDADTESIPSALAFK